MSADGDGEGSNGISGATLGDSRTQQRISNGPATNGTHKATNSTRSVNGSSRQNGKQQSHAVVPNTPYFGHDREEVTRILIQALSDLGHHAAAERVSRDSGYELESPTVAAFRAAVTNGSWDEAEGLLFGTAVADGPHHSGTGLLLVEDADPDVMRFRIRQQKYLELLEQRDTRQALAVLRTELTPLNQDPQQVNFLSTLLMCQSANDIKIKARWDGADGQSRNDVLAELSKSISPTAMLPEHRLAVLFQQIKDRQLDTCKWHTTPTTPSLYSDHTCEQDLFPNKLLHELEQPGEVWQIRFSNNGKYLASCGADKHVYIWDTSTLAVVFKLGHELREQRGDEPVDEGVGNVSWSPDDSMLVACERDKCATIWDMKTGTVIQRTKRLVEPVSSCVWAPDGDTFVLGSFDKAHALTTWNTKGEELFTWESKFRVEDLTISPDSRWLVAMDDQSFLHVYDYQTRGLRYDLELECRGTSIRISADSRYLLVNKKDAIAQLINIATTNTVQKYMGHYPGDFTIRSDLGGANELYVISGSEDGSVLIWHMPSGRLVEKLDAHRPRCNAVAWSPTDPCLWASCGDDARIRL
ncbi:unnamed protein product [Discula destructiva]